MEPKTIRRVALSLVAIAPAWAARAEPMPEAGYRAMVDRPLFSPTRRPPPAPAPLSAPVLPDPPAPRPDLALSGVITGGGGGVALVRRAQDPSPLRVVLGGQIDGWTVAEIHPRAIVLTRDARSVTVGLSASPR